jgi:hypothetical protein
VRTTRTGLNPVLRVAALLMFRAANSGSVSKQVEITKSRRNVPASVG